MAVAASLAQQRVHHVVSSGDATLLDLGNAGVVAVRCTPDAAVGRALLSGARHPSWVLLDVADGEVVKALFASAGRVPRSRWVSVGAALHLAISGVPTFVRSEVRR